MSLTRIQKSRPFLKWAGGKFRLLPQLRELFPRDLVEGRTETYIEPFLGGGAMFFEIAATISFDRAILSDVNPDLVLTYRVVQQKTDELLAILSEIQRLYHSLTDEDRSEYFYEIREQYNRQSPASQTAALSPTDVSKAAKLIFLNKTCFNGLYRVNSRGKFNVPFGRYKHPKICDVDRITGASKALSKAKLLCGSFLAVEKYVSGRTFLYFDPPYRPLSGTSSFTSYAEGQFPDSEQLQLAGFCKRLSEQTDVRLMVSNSDPKNTRLNDDFFEEAYSGFHIHRVLANRMINSTSSKRGKISELVIVNYHPSNA